MSNLGLILVPVDYSACADDALRLAGGFARAFQARFLVLHLLPWRVEGFLQSPPLDWIATEKPRLAEHVRAVLERGATPPVFEIAVEWGSPHADLVPFAIDRKADMIVMGTHGRTGITHVLLGSVAEKTVRLAPCPVVTVREGAAADRALDRLAAEPPHRLDVRPGEVDHLVVRTPVTVTPTDLLSTAHDRMVEHRIRHLGVVEGDRLVGILSDRDIVAHLGHLQHTRVNAAMTPNPTTIAPDVAIETAARLMIEQGVRALPVVDGERIVGVLSATDILEEYVRAARRAA